MYSRAQKGTGRSLRGRRFDDGNDWRIRQSLPEANVLVRQWLLKFLQRLSFPLTFRLRVGSLLVHGSAGYKRPSRASRNGVAVHHLGSRSKSECSFPLLDKKTLMAG
jgi:hypothetical protein